MASSRLYTILMLPEYELSCRAAKYILGVISGKEDNSLLQPLTGTLEIRE